MPEPQFHQAAVQPFPESRAVGLGEIHMGHLAVFPVEEGVHPAFGKVQQLAGHHKGAGRQSPVQGSHCRKGQDLRDPQFFQGKDVGPVIDLVGRDAVVQAVPGQEIDLMAGGGPLQAAGLAEGRFHRKRSQLPEGGGVLHPGAADDPDFAQCNHLSGFDGSTKESRSFRVPMVWSGRMNRSKKSWEKEVQPTFTVRQPAFLPLTRS